jgi:hypothetical protein
VKRYFLITIDTEGDNLWARPAKVTTENARYLPRFQALCDTYGFKPTYLVNHEMAIEPEFQKVGKAVVRHCTGEIGLHIHPWDSPPVVADDYDPRWDHIYLTDLSDEQLHSKIAYLTELLCAVFESRPVSHRAGRWGFDARVARALVEHGYRTDCSVTPGVNWGDKRGKAGGQRGTDYRGFPQEPYWLDLQDISRRGSSKMLEVPVTIMPAYPVLLEHMYGMVEKGRIGSAMRRLFGSPRLWLRPDGRNMAALLRVVDWAILAGLPALEFMLHSSELMPGGSSRFKTAAQIETLYGHLDTLFRYVAARDITGATLTEFSNAWTRVVPVGATS